MFNRKNETNESTAPRMSFTRDNLNLLDSKGLLIIDAGLIDAAFDAKEARNKAAYQAYVAQINKALARSRQCYRTAYTFEALQNIGVEFTH